MPGHVCVAGLAVQMERILISRGAHAPAFDVRCDGASGGSIEFIGLFLHFKVQRARRF